MNEIDTSPMASDSPVHNICIRRWVELVACILNIKDIY